MDISLERNYLTAYRAGERMEKLCDIVVTDTKDDILRILISAAKYKLRSKDAENGKISIRGELEVNTAYVPEGGGIDTLRADMPFECVFENESIRAGGFALAEISIVSLDTRILNPRKIMVTAKLLCSVKYYDVDEYEWYQKPSNCACRAFYKEKTLNAFFIDSACEKSFSIENDFEITDAEEDAAILYTSTSFITDSAEAVGSKMIVKGHSESEITVISGGKLKKYTRMDAFSQIFELSERDTVPEYSAYAVQTGDFFELNNGIISYELSAVMQLICRKKTPVGLLCDAYACDADIVTEKTDTKLCVSVSREKKTEPVRLDQSFEHDIISTDSVSLTVGVARETDTGLSIPLYADVIYTSSDGELRACRIHGSVNTDCGKNGEYRISVQNVRASYNGREINVSAELVLVFECFAYESCECIRSMSIGEGTCNCDRSSVYIARYDDDLWQLAKRYRSDVEAIKALNGADEIDKLRGKLIVIPIA